MGAEWESVWSAWLTVELALDEWRERIEGVAAEEAAHLASLPYVQGVAIIGSVGRGSEWPLSDIDLLVMAESPDGRRPSASIREVEAERNGRLRALRIPNEVEAGLWAVLPEIVAAAAECEVDAFVEVYGQWPWLGFPSKLCGGRVVADEDGRLGEFVGRWGDAVFSDRFVEVLAEAMIEEAGRELAQAAALAQSGKHAHASAFVIRTTYMMTAAAYALWRRLPQSLSRGVTRFMAAATEAGGPAIADLFLAASRLTEDETWERLQMLPPEGRRERDLVWQVRQGCGEVVGELGATRDFLYDPCMDATSEGASPRAPWHGVSDRAEAVAEQLDAAHEMVRRLERARYGGSPRKGSAPPAAKHGVRSGGGSRWPMRSSSS